MRPREFGELQRLKALLESDDLFNDLPGLAEAGAVDSFALQLIDSRRRVEFVSKISKMEICSDRLNPCSQYFDPIRASISHFREGHVDEACWLVFLATHFGHNAKSKWRLTRDIYGALGTKMWTWDEVTRDMAGFRNWLAGAEVTLRGGDGVHRAFGNHRKYTSLDAWKPNATGDAIASYVAWIQRNGGHQAMLVDALTASLGDPGAAFDRLYSSMAQVASFGRIGRFDYLTMLGKTGIAPISPPSPYFKSATGPLSGAKLLFGSGKSVRDYETKTVALGSALGFGMQIMEDAICNWQKSPTEFKPFRG